MGLYPFQSPFSILGLKYGEHSNETIKKAYQIMCLYSHPDKGLFSKDSPKYFLLVNAAFEYLREGYETNTFQGYPILFSKKDGSYIYSIPSKAVFTVCGCGEVISSERSCGRIEGCKLQKFTVCSFCHTAIPLSGQKMHLKAHDMCFLCDEVGSDAHFRERHPDTICPVCDVAGLESIDSHIKEHTIQACIGCEDVTATSTELLRHIQEDHIHCPLCKKDCGDNFYNHLRMDHSFEPDSCCDTNLANLGHYKQAHKWIICPHPDCGLHIGKTQLWKHLSNQHHFQRCSSCPLSEERFESDIAHAATHKWVACHICRKSMMESNLPYHQATQHEWLLCEYCNRAEETEEMLKEHQDLDHRFCNCELCSSKLLEQDLPQHLHETHGWIICPLCKDSFLDLVQHFTDSHPPTKQCGLCQYKDTATGLQHHMRVYHHWKTCSICSLPVDPAKMQPHITEEHKGVSCQECHETVPEWRLNDHKQTEHGFRSCFQCDFTGDLTKLLTHITQHYVGLVPPGTDNNARKQGTEGKCSRCRNDRKRCETEEGQTKCKRCASKNYECSERTVIRRKRKRDNMGGSGC